MERKAIEKFLKEKKGYNENDIACFWEDYLIVDPNFEYTERELDMFACKKGDECDAEKIKKILWEIDDLFSDEEFKKTKKELREWYSKQENNEQRGY